MNVSQVEFQNMKEDIVKDMISRLMEERGLSMQDAFDYTSNLRGMYIATCWTSCQPDIGFVPLLNGWRFLFGGRAIASGGIGVYDGEIIENITI